MTLGELNEICYGKIWQKDPLRLREIPAVAHSPEEYEAIVGEIVEQYEMSTAYGTMLMHAISEVFSTLNEELGMPTEEIGKLPPDTELPPRACALAEKLRDFPPEMTEGV